jgi:hypothetical protein
VSNQSAGLRDRGPRRTSTFKDAAIIGFTSVLFRRIPSGSS